MLNTQPGDEIEFAALWAGLRRQRHWILLTALGLGLAVFLWFSAQPPVYEATSSLSTTAVVSLATVRETVVTALPVPDGALQDALQGPVVMGRLIALVQGAAGLPATRRAALTAHLQREFQQQRVRTVQLESRIDPGGNGIYLLTAQGRSPGEAVILNDLAAQALLEWDLARASAGLLDTQRRVTAQLAEVSRQLGRADLSVTDQQALLASQGSLRRIQTQLGVQALGIRGFLERVAPPTPPQEPVSPRPLRDALLVGVLGLVFGTGLAALRTVADRSVRDEDTLLALGWPVLGTVPADQRGQGGIGFVRVNLGAQLGRWAGHPILVTSSRESEGADQLTLSMAAELASTGLRVLIIEAGPRSAALSPTAGRLASASWRQLCGVGGARILWEALDDPGNVQALELQPGVDLLPSGSDSDDVPGRLGRHRQAAALGDLFARWGAGHDLVLISGPALLTDADSLMLGAHVAGAVVAVREGRFRFKLVQQALRRAENAGVHVLGLVLTKPPAGTWIPGLRAAAGSMRQGL
ncbi:non-specific protein-tyrosine kinase [Deinococcus metalli]|nr:succinoglycan biosynthesis protein exop [Deinococcus metalli]MBB5375783.1 non-specific protein-tyrosine kinase [Deinococcus metalli]